MADEVADAEADEVAEPEADEVVDAEVDEVDVETPVRNSGAPIMTRATTNRGRLISMTRSSGKPSASPVRERRVRLTCAPEGRIATGVA